MRGDGVGVGDVGALSCGARGRRDTSGGDDGRGAGGKRDAGVVGGHSRNEQDAADEPRWHGISVDDGTRIEFGDGVVYSAGEGGAHGMRGDGVGVLHISAVSCGARGSRDTSCGGDVKGTRWERKSGLVSRHSKAE